MVQVWIWCRDRFACIFLYEVWLFLGVSAFAYLGLVESSGVLLDVVEQPRLRVS